MHPCQDTERKKSASPKEEVVQEGLKAVKALMWGEGGCLEAVYVEHFPCVAAFARDLT